MFNMYTIKNDVKKITNSHNSKMYKIANIIGITQSILYHCYLKNDSKNKLAKIRTTIKKEKAGAAEC